LKDKTKKNSLVVACKETANIAAFYSILLQFINFLNLLTTSSSFPPTLQCLGEKSLVSWSVQQERC